MRILAWPLSTPGSPYTEILYSHLGRHVGVDGWPGNLLRKYDVWHMHWPDALLGIPNTVHATFKVSGMFGVMDFLRARGTKIIWTMHNLASHEARHPRLEAWFWRHFIPRVDGVITLSEAGLELGCEKFPQLRDVAAVVIPHGHYRGQYPPGAEDARRSLGLPRELRIAMFIGYVRAYKNVPTLVKAFRGVRDQRAMLYVAGRSNSPPLAQEIRKVASLDSRVQLKLEFIEDRDISTYISAADVIVLPYREILNSGSALLALSFNRPVVVPDRGSMGELQREFGEGWVRTFPGELTTAVLEDALEWAARPRPAACLMPEKYEWEHIGKETVRFFERVTGIAANEITQESQAKGQRSGRAGEAAGLRPAKADER